MGTGMLQVSDRRLAVLETGLNNNRHGDTRIASHEIGEYNKPGDKRIAGLVTGG
jgi:hypothetical protein